MAIAKDDQKQDKYFGSRDESLMRPGTEAMEVADSDDTKECLANVETEGVENTEDVSGGGAKRDGDVNEGAIESQTNVATETKIDVNIPQVEKDENHNGNGENGNRNDDDDEDDQVDDGTRSVVMGTTKSVTFSVHHNIDEVDAEIARVTMANKTSDDQMSNFEVEVDHYGGGRAATTNTPVTDVIIEYPDDDKSSRRTQTPSRENIYEHAISVMRNRSSMTHYTQSQATIKSTLNLPVSSHPPPSSAPAAVLTRVMPAKAADGLPIYDLPMMVSRIEQPPFVDSSNCTFYVAQKRRRPVPPVKAWKGYHSNVYFEPMICKKAELTSPNSRPNKYPQNMMPQTGEKTPPESGTIELPEIVSPPMSQKTRSQTASTKSVRIAQSAISARTATKSRASTSTVPKSRPLTTATSTRQMAVLDKLSVLNTMDSNIREDIKWIDGIESTGTLQVGEPLRPTGTTTHQYRRSAGSKHYKMRICRGLVSHTLAGQYNSTPPNGVSGGRMLDSPSKLEHLEHEYQGESPFLSNPHGMFSSPVPSYSLHSLSPLPSLHHRQLSASTVHNPATVSSSKP